MAPAHAILIWADAQNIYCAPQATPSAVMAFPFSESGLMRALRALGAAPPLDAEPYTRPQITPKALVKENLTLEDLAAAAKALKDLGIIR